MEKKKKYTFCIHSLQAGGMERVCWQLLTYLSEYTDFQLDLVLFGKEPEMFFNPPSSVQVHVPKDAFNEHWRLFSTYKRMKWLRKSIRKIDPDRVISFGEYWNNLVLLSLMGTSNKVIVSDRSQPNKSLGIFHESLRRWLYPRAYLLIAQTLEARQIFEKKIHTRQWVVMGNPIRDMSCPRQSRRKEILMVGRFIESKHQDHLIRIFAKLNALGWTLVLVGDDHLKQQNRKRWEALAEQLGVKDRVLFEGKRNNVDDYYCRASIFAFTSSSEGFPNVIGEAQSAGLPVVAYDCVAGPSEMIKDGINGYLVPLFNETEFQHKLQLLVDFEELRESFGKKAKETIQDYSVEAIGKQFLKLLDT